MDFSGYRPENTWDPASSGGIIRNNRKTYQSLLGPPNLLSGRANFGIVRQDRTGVGFRHNVLIEEASVWLR